MGEPGREKKEPYKRLAEINRAITTSLNFNKVLNLIVENAVQLVNARLSLLLLLDKDGLLRIRAAKGIEPALWKSFAGEMEEDVIRRLQKSLSITPDETLLPVPVVAKDSLDGLLVVARAQPFAEEEEWLISALADQAAIALSNARLYEMELAQTSRERDETLEALRISNDKINSILESITDLFYSLDREWRFVDMNRHTETRFRKSREELIGKVIWEVYPDAVNSPLFTNLHKAMEEMKPVHFELASRIVPGVWFEAHGYPAPEGLTVYLREITERKKAEITNQLLAAIVESSEDAIVSKTLEGIITTWNKGAEHMFGYTAAEVIGKPITIIIPADRLDEEPVILKRIREDKRVDHYETVRQRKDGSFIDISLSVSPIRNEEGEIIGASKIARDISESKRAEKERLQLLESERLARSEAEAANRLKDEFLATLSHELRNPLNVILGYAEVLLRSEESKQSPFVKRTGEILKRNALAQSQLVRDLLDLSRLHMGKLSLNPETVSLGSIIDNAVETVHAEADSKQIKIRVEAPEEVLFIYADPLRMEQVVWNLLNNAVKFTPPGGTVRVGLGSENQHAVMQVEDTGQGIDPEFLPHVFEMFRQADATKSRRHSGLGIGLALVEELVRLQDGSVAVHSDGPGKGARFTVTLPLSNELERPLMTNDQAETLALQDLRILVVDDSQDTIEMLRHLFEMDGAMVTTAGSGNEALKMVQESEFDVMLSDISMPGMDGFELLQRLRNLPGGADLPVLALTGFGRAEDVERAEAEGFFSHVTKPIDLGKLVEILRTLPAKNRSSVAKAQK
jgi:PAS domain S-box-containing protein